tara:strand:- start:621 stop:812 length:192 start_codon:yes stop_codon:yes gene_type:complete
MSIPNLDSNKENMLLKKVSNLENVIKEEKSKKDENKPKITKVSNWTNHGWRNGFDNFGNYGGG